jgi:hypothetical protein
MTDAQIANLRDRLDGTMAFSANVSVDGPHEKYILNVDVVGYRDVVHRIMDFVAQLQRDAEWRDSD